MKEVGFPLNVIVAIILIICFCIPVAIGVYDQHLRYLDGKKKPDIEIKRPKDEYENLDV